MCTYVRTYVGRESVSGKPHPVVYAATSLSGAQHGCGVFHQQAAVQQEEVSFPFCEEVREVQS